MLIPSPEAIRRVAGGRVRSARPPDSRTRPNFDRGSGRGGDSRRLVFDPRLLPELDAAPHMNPYASPSGDGAGRASMSFRVMADAIASPHHELAVRAPGFADRWRGGEVRVSKITV